MERKKPYVKHHSVHRLGGSLAILLPREWFEANNIPFPRDGEKLELLVIADSDIKIVNPNHEKGAYDEITRIVGEPVMPFTDPVVDDGRPKREKRVGQSVPVPTKKE